VVGEGREVDDAAPSAIREVVLELLVIAQDELGELRDATDESILKSLIGRTSWRRS
jgi:hypothetical protein